MGKLASIQIEMQRVYRWLEKGDFGRAGKRLRQIVDEYPRHAQAWFLLGALCGQGGDMRGALQASQRAVELDPKHADAWYNLAQARMHLNQLGRAIEAYRQVIQLRPDHFDSWNSIGVALHELNRPKEAIPYYQKALELRPDSAPTRFMLASAGGDAAPESAPPDYVRELFDRYADKFDQQLVGALEYRTPELLEQLLVSEARSRSYALEALRILDFGCGTGLMGPRLRAFGRRLVGIDLSPGMLEKARARKVYDELIAGELGALLERGEAAVYDLITAADVYPYIGAMEETFSQCRRLLREQGWFALSVEAWEGAEAYVLRDTNRYAHASAYVRDAARDLGFRELARADVVLRKNRGQPVHGHLFLFQACGR